LWRQAAMHIEQNVHLVTHRLTHGAQAGFGSV